MAVNWDCMAQKRSDVIEFYRGQGYSGYTNQAIFLAWWELNRAAAGDPSANYATIETYATQLGCNNPQVTQAPIPSNGQGGGGGGAGNGEFTVGGTFGNLLSKDPTGGVLVIGAMGFAALTLAKQLWNR